MNPSFLRLSHPASRLLFAALSCLAVGNACSSDAAAPATPITFSVDVSSLDGHAVDQEVDLRCDHGGTGASDASAAFSTLAVSVALSPTEAGRNFVLSPANACGSSTRCGFIRIEALDATDGVLAHVETVTTDGVLKLGVQQLPELAQVRVSLIRGLDQKPLLNPDKTAVTSVVKPTFVVPTSCAALPTPGAGGDTSSGGAAGDTSTPTLGGAGGDAATPALGGAAGDTATPALGGAAGDSMAAGGIGGA